MFKKTMVVISLVLAMLVVAVPVAAVDPVPDYCVDSIFLDGVTVCFMGYDDNGDGTTTWTYAVEADDSTETNALSHLTLGICIEDEDAVVPGSGDVYETIPMYGNALGDVYGREGIFYQVVIGMDPTTSVYGIKFEEGTSLGLSEIDIFQFTQPTQVGGTAPTLIAVKSGAEGETGMIEGPLCGGTAAVDLTSLNASGGLFARVLSWLGLR